MFLSDIRADDEGMTLLDRPDVVDPEFATEPPAHQPHRTWPWALAVASFVGIVSGGITIVDKIALLQNPVAGSFCDVNAQLGCTPVLLASQSSVLGPPNALLGVIMFAVLGTSGLVVATGGRSSAGYRKAMVGLAVFFALFLTWYMAQVAFVIGSLCPFCTVCAACVLVAVLATTAWPLIRMARDSSARSRGSPGAIPTSSWWWAGESSSPRCCTRASGSCDTPG